MRRRQVLVTALSVLAVLAAPGLARAASTVQTTVVDGQDVVVVTDDDSAADIETERGVDGSDKFVAVQNAAGATPGSGCGAVSAQIVACIGEFEAVVVFANGGNDKVSMSLIEDGDPPLIGEMYGGEGDDELTAPPDTRDVPQPTTYVEGGNGNDTITSGNGADDLRGEGGNDTLSANEGPDAVRGGEGDDSVSGGSEEPEPFSADVVDGGPGFDSMPDSPNDYNRLFDDDVTVTVDGLADDGEPGEGDNVIDVEKFRVTANHATIVGTPGNDDIFVEANTSTIRGLGGNDRLVAYDGNDTIEGGDGDDFLEGGFGNDVLDGGPGLDAFSGDRVESNVFAVGNDQIRARDGIAEQIDCGIGGGDSAEVDASDVVSSNCESVSRSGPGPDGPGPNGPNGPGPNGPNTPGAPGVVGSRKIGRIRRNGLLIRITCPAACTVTAELRIGRALARRLKLGRSRVLARGRATLASAGEARVRLRIVRKARRRFRRLRRAAVTLRTSTTINGVTTPGSLQLTLRR